MNTTDIEIRIPAAIALLPVTITEKIVLAHIAKLPGCSNGRLAKLIGGSRRGIEEMVRRLRQQGFIITSGDKHFLIGQQGCRVLRPCRDHRAVC